MHTIPIPCHLPRVVMRALPTLALGSFALALCAAQTPPAAPSHSPSQDSSPANAQVAALEIPKSVFANPATPQDGIDPFFPRSTRHRPPPPPSTAAKETKKPAPPVVEVQLELKGISGTVERRLAIINNKTFETGEQAEVITNVGRIRITCKEIKTDSVEVVVNGQARTLSLRSKL